VLWLWMGFKVKRGVAAALVLCHVTLSSALSVSAVQKMHTSFSDSSVQTWQLPQLTCSGAERPCFGCWHVLLALACLQSLPNVWWGC
jgi:hypothetical protein